MEQFIPFIVIVIIIGSLIKSKSKSGITLVLKKFNISPDVTNDINFIDIEGRRPGIIAWFLTKIGIDDTTKLEVNLKGVSFKTASLNGEETSILPLLNIASITSGFSKNIFYIIFAGVFIIGGFIISANTYNGGWISVLGIVLGLVCLVGYWLTKKFVLLLQTSGGGYFGISFKPSVIENVNVDINKVKETIVLINQAILKIQSK
jgi:hypothetical protein